MATTERRLSAASTASSLTSVKHDHAPSPRLVDQGRSWRRWKAIIPGVVFRHCQPGSDWTSARVRRIHRLLLITLPSLPLLVAALVSAVNLQHRYGIVVDTGIALVQTKLTSCWITMFSAQHLSNCLEHTHTHPVVRTGPTCGEWWHQLLIALAATRYQHNISIPTSYRQHHWYFQLLGVCICLTTALI